MTDSKKLIADKTGLIIGTQKQHGNLVFPDTYADPEFHTGRLSTHFRGQL